VNPLCCYLGKSYADWTSEWFNWLLSAHADSHNLGPVMFLRPTGLPSTNTSAYTSDVVHTSLQKIIGTNTLQDPHRQNIDECQAKYANDPNVRIGSDRLQIFDDQAIFVPLVITYDIANAQYNDWGNLQDTGSTMDGDNTPDHHQLTINNKPIDLPEGLSMTEFRITTPIFTAVVPDVPYGISMKDFLDNGPITPGSYPAMVAGYFFMLKFNPGSYWIHAWASADRQGKPYFSELLYLIKVEKR